jgi:glycosyltransferase involved in cell wall biosynthesis
MHIAILAPSHKSFISDFLPYVNISELPEGIPTAPFIGSLIKEMLGMKHIVTAITLTTALNHDYSTKRFKYNNFEWIVIPCRPHSIRFNGSKIGRILDFFLYEKSEIIKYINTVSPDIVHAHWSYEYAGAALECGYPHLITVHDNAVKVLLFFKNIYRLGRFIMSELYLRKARFVSTVSPYMWQYTFKRCRNVRIIPNPTAVSSDFKLIQSLISDKLNTLNSARIIMINNGWDKRKNGRNALLAFQLLKNSMPNISLHLFGYGSEKGGDAQRDALSIRLDDVNYYGIVSHKRLKEELSKSHLLLHPSLEESFGVILIEAMASGIPAIGGNNSGAVPWVLNNKFLEVDVTNPNIMHLKMLELLNNKNCYKEASNASYKNVINRFSISEVTGQYINYYHDILSFEKEI